MKNKSDLSLKNQLYHRIRPVLDDMRSVDVSPHDLILMQKFNDEFCHYDIIIKYMVLEHEFDNMHPDIWNTYKILQMRGNQEFANYRVDQYHKTIDSLRKNGYMPSGSISVDKNMLICDGSHRAAMALYYNAETIKILVHSTDYAAEQRIKEYRIGYPFSQQERYDIESKLNELLDKANAPLNIVLCGDNADKADKTAELLQELGAVSNIQHYSLDTPLFHKLCGNLIETADIYKNNYNTKIATKNPKIAIINLKLNCPEFTIAEKQNNSVLKKFIPHRIPVIKQSKDIRRILCQKATADNDLLFIPENFCQNRKFSDLLSVL